MAETKRGSLHYAAAKGDVTTVIELLENGADPNELDYDKRTALHIAAANGQTRVMEALVTRGARIDIGDRWGRTPLDEAITNNHDDAIQFLSTRGATRKANVVMFKKQVSFLQIDPSSNLAMLFDRVVNNDLDGVKRLVEGRGVNVNDVDDDKRSAVHLAASEGHLDILRYLVSRKANINLRDRFGNRPLNDALRGQHNECVDFLVQSGAIASELRDYTSSEDEITSPKALTLKHVSKEALYELHQRGVREFWSWDRDDFEMDEKPFAAGAGGQVFHARFREMDVVAKTLGQLSVTQDQVTDLANEISLMASIRHPYIVSFYGACFQLSPPVMLIEYCSGGNLESRILKAYNQDDPKRLTNSQKLKYIHQIALAMTFLHRFHVPIIHRDLKPGNILLTGSDDIKITDFGLAKFTPTFLLDSNGETSGYKMTGETGSYRFMAPEVFEHKSYDRKVDVYAFAMIAYWLYSGIRPFVKHRDGVDAVREAVKGVRPYLEIKEKKIEELIKQCWDQDPEKRPEFASIAKLCEDMKHSGVGKKSSGFLNFISALNTSDATMSEKSSLAPHSTMAGAESRGGPRKPNFFARLFGKKT